MSLDFHVPSNVIIGNETISRLPEIATGNKEKVVIVADENLQESGLTNKTKRMLENYAHGIIIYEVPKNANSSHLFEGVDIIKNSRADVVIGLGGENVLSVAKVMAQFSTQEHSKEEYKSHRRLGVKKVKYIEVPTIQSILWGLIPYTYVTDSSDNVKKIYSDETAMAEAIIVDPTLTEDAALNDVIYYSLEAIAYSFDAFISRKSNAFSDAFSSKSIEYLSMNLKRLGVEAANIKIKGNLSMGAVMSSLAIKMSSLGSCAASGMSLQAQSELEQHIGTAIILPHVMEFNLTAAANKFLQIGLSLGEKVSDITVIEAAIAAIETIRRIMLDLHIPQRLSEYNVSQGQIESAAGVGASYEYLAFNPRAAGRNEMNEILGSAY